MDDLVGSGERTSTYPISGSEVGVQMGWSWVAWGVGAVVLLAAGFGTALAPRWRARHRGRRIAWSSARAAIESAAISRDAATVPVPEAERLLTRAELIAADRGGPDAARSATEYARQADQLWRESARG